HVTPGGRLVFSDRLEWHRPPVDGARQSRRNTIRQLHHWRARVVSSHERRQARATDQVSPEFRKRGHTRPDGRSSSQEVHRSAESGRRLLLYGEIARHRRPVKVPKPPPPRLKWFVWPERVFCETVLARGLYTVVEPALVNHTAEPTGGADG